MDSPTLFECHECGLHYEDRETAEKCDAWCREHQSCNLEITRHSVERKRAKRQAENDGAR